MKFKDFIKEKLIGIFLVIFALATIEIFLMAYPYGNFIKIYIPLTILVVYFIGLMIEYTSKKNFYANLSNTLNNLDEKYLVTEIINTPNFIEGKILKSSLEQIDKSMLEHVNKYKYLQEDYKEYIELWIHEIKIPIAASKMVIENNKNEATKSIDEELNKVEDYIEQALFYARSNTVEKDYYIKASNLKDIINESIKKNKSILIQNKMLINLHDLDRIVHTDSKWIIFILNQIIQNSVKYRKQDNNSGIEIYSKQGKENVILYIKDNGIGIKKGEITRAFEKGFTGTNGRLQNKKSTGIGLYLCKKLCDKLGIAIELSSIQNEGTELRLVFPKNSYINLK
ncbi:MAG: sensor histidine kinase [Clostridia bacterium]|nr:sensor histidine kinase [Clostridia bacterium]